MFCVKCGKELPEGAAFCPYCGHKQGAEAETVTGTGEAPVRETPGVTYARPVNSSPIKKARYNVLCIVGLVIGAMAVVFEWIPMDLFKVLSILAGIGAIIVSAIGVVRCNRTNENGRAHGVLGAVFGTLAIVLVIVDFLL